MCFTCTCFKCFFWLFFLSVWGAARAQFRQDTRVGKHDTGRVGTPDAVPGDRYAACPDPDPIFCCRTNSRLQRCCQSRIPGGTRDQIKETSCGLVPRNPGYFCDRGQSTALRARGRLTRTSSTFTFHRDVWKSDALFLFFPLLYLRQRRTLPTPLPRRTNVISAIATAYPRQKDLLIHRVFPLQFCRCSSTTGQARRQVGLIALSM